MKKEELAAFAEAAMAHTYSPYSGIHVGAALLGASGKVYTGCNIENAAFSPTCCAERTAFFKAISEGEREFDAIAIAGGTNGVVTDVFPPCGVCRQVMAEFCTPKFVIFLVKRGGVEETTLGALLPMGFSKDKLN